MNDKERKSCINTIELLRRLAFNVHGVMDVIDAQNCDKIIEMLNKPEPHYPTWYAEQIKALPSAQPEIIRCKDCKHNPKHEWFGCPMSHLSEKQRPETAWCWRAEGRTDE